MQPERLPTKTPLVRYLDETAPIDCPYGQVRRVVTGGEGGVANVHVVEVTRGGLHLHRAYDETYFVLEGHGTMVLGDATHRLRPGAVVVIPPEVPHSLEADEGEVLRFVIFGTPAMPISDPRAAPTRPD